MSRVHRSYHKKPNRWMRYPTEAPVKPKKLYTFTDWCLMMLSTFAVTVSFCVLWLAGG